MALALCRFILVLMDEGFNPEDSKIAELFFLCSEGVPEFSVGDVNANKTNNCQLGKALLPSEIQTWFSLARKSKFSKDSQKGVQQTPRALSSYLQLSSSVFNI